MKKLLMFITKNWQFKLLLVWITFLTFVMLETMNTAHYVESRISTISYNINNIESQVTSIESEKILRLKPKH